MVEKSILFYKTAFPIEKVVLETYVKQNGEKDNKHSLSCWDTIAKAAEPLNPV